VTLGVIEAVLLENTPHELCVTLQQLVEHFLVLNVLATTCG